MKTARTAGETTEQRPSASVRVNAAAPAAAAMLREFLITSTGRPDRRRETTTRWAKSVIIAASFVRKSERATIADERREWRGREKREKEPRTIPTRKRSQIEREVSGKTIRLTSSSSPLQRRNKLRIPFLPNVERKLKINGRRERGRGGSEMMRTRKGIPSYSPIGSDKIDEA